MNKFLTLLTASLLLSAACDSGDIHEQVPDVGGEGIAIRMTGRLTGAQSWSDRYQVVLAAFSDGSDYSLVQKDIPSAVGEGDSVHLVLGNVPSSASKVELCVVDRVRERIAVFRELKLTPAMFARKADTVKFEVGHPDVGMYGVVEHHLFDNLCGKCHGNNGHAAADMDLRVGHAAAATVGVPSTLDASRRRIVPGDADNSWLVRVLTEGNENLTHYKDHTLILNNERDNKYFGLLKDWINHGARH